MRLLALLLGLSLGYWSWEGGCFLLAEKFSPGAIRATVPRTTSLYWGSLPDTLGCHFRFLGGGSQCVAFESLDGQWVLKFFRHSRTRLPAWLFQLPLPSNIRLALAARQEKKEEKGHRFFSSSLLAYEELQEECALCALHLGIAPASKRWVILEDKLGRRRRLWLDNYDFILQRRAQVAHSYTGPSARKLLEELLRRRYEKGIGDEDAVVGRNCGFIGNQAVFIDIGCFKHDPILKESGAQERQLSKELAAFL